jgi:Carboxypeptidase regulatory-like domain/TonB-dependent Receptor Plug Domain
MRPQVTPRRPGFLTLSACELLVCALLLLLPGVHPLHGQGSGSISGTTIDAQTGMPIVGASITIPLFSRAVISDEGGHFLHSTLEPGSYVVQVHAVGYIPSAKAFDLTTGQSATHVFQLTTLPPVLPEVVVRGKTRSVGRRFEDFDRRRALKRGQFLTRAEIEARSAVNLSDLLQTMRGIRTECVGFTCIVETSRSTHGCRPAYFVDGRMSTTFGPSTPVRDIEGIEVYLGPSETPAEFLGPDSGCGVIGIWTKSSP